MSDEFNRRLDRLERDSERTEETLRALVLQTTRMGDILEAQKQILPKIDILNDEVTELKIAMSNARLIQKGVVGLGALVASSAVAMAMAAVFGG